MHLSNLCEFSIYLKSNTKKIPIVMGGFFYDREVETVYVPPPATTSTTTVLVSHSNNVQLSLPRESFGKDLTCAHGCPIVCAIDVTGTMGNWACYVTGL
jgi:hypothetical protein